MIKKLFLAISAASILSACASQPYISTEDIQYLKDPRSDLCFAVVHSPSAKQQIAVTSIDCNSVEGLLSINSLSQNASEKIADKKDYYTIRSFASF